MELKVLVLNINSGKNEALMDHCKILKEYTQYVERVRTYARTMDISHAVERAITECIKDGILSDFLTKSRAEVKQMSIFEYDEEAVMKLIRQDEWEDGREAGIAEGIIKGKEAGIREGKIKGLFLAYQDMHLSEEEIIRKLSEKLDLRIEEVCAYLE